MNPSSRLFVILAVLIVGICAPVPAWSTDWQAKLGAQSQDKGRLVLALLPNEFWIHVNDTITWTPAVDALHTVTLPAGAVRLPFFVGCPGFSTSPATFSGSCISAQAFTSPNSFTVLFAETGNFKLTCLLHEDMTGVVHVLEASAPLPHDQAFYDTQGAQQARELLAAQGMTMGDMQTENHEADVPNTVIAGTRRSPSCVSSNRKLWSTSATRLSGRIQMPSHRTRLPSVPIRQRPLETFLPPM